MSLYGVGGRDTPSTHGSGVFVWGQPSQRGHPPRASGSEDKWPPAKSSVGQVGRSGNTHHCVCVSVFLPDPDPHCHSFTLLFGALVRVGFGSDK